MLKLVSTDSLSTHHELNKFIKDVRDQKKETPLPDNPLSYTNFITNFNASHLQLLNGESGNSGGSGTSNGNNQSGNKDSGRKVDLSRAITNKAHNPE